MTEAADHLLNLLQEDGSTIDAAIREIAEHQKNWSQTLYYTPPGWTDGTATAYRMAMEWSVEQLARAYGWED